jgi:rhodanese-related sulfurtransferase
LSHDVFISHSSLDKLAADAVCHGLEAKGIRCWIAPRDQVAGRPYGEQITSAIEHAQVIVLVFSDHVNNSQAVLNEINIAAGANVTIVPFRLAKVEFNSELHFYLGRMHWLDAFPQPVDAYIDALVDTIQRNLKQPAAGAEVAAAAATSPPPPPPSVQPGLATHPPGPPAAHPRSGAHPGLIVGGALGGLFLVLLIVAAWPRPPNPVRDQATNTMMQAVANAIAKNAGDDGDGDTDNATKPAGVASTMPKGDGSEIAPVRAANPTAVNYYETLIAPGGPPPLLDGATVINTQQLLASMRERDAGATSFFLIDARGCATEPTIPTAVCLTSNSIDQLEAKAPDKAVQLVIFCHDGGCPLSYQLASAAVAAGYDNVFWYRGGINAWAAAGEPTVIHNGVEQ